MLAVRWCSLAAAVALLSMPLATAPARAAEDVRPTGETRPIIDDATLRREYGDYRASLAGMRRYHVRYIRVATEHEARDLIARIRSGARFEDMARKHSTHAESAASGGDLGEHAGCRWGKSTLEMLDSLERGQTWPKAVKGTHGWGIYRLESVVDIEPRSFDRYRDELLAGTFEPECPWVPPVTVAPSGQGAGRPPPSAGTGRH